MADDDEDFKLLYTQGKKNAVVDLPGRWCANEILFFFFLLCYTHGTHIYYVHFSFLLDPYYMADDWIAFRYLCVCV